MSWIAGNQSADLKGYWEPHSSSVDFCELNYLWSPFIAEFHNAWSSLLISLLGIIGILYGNPTKEWRFFICYLVLMSIGFGSFLLHSTLHWLPQSSDEVPMLWLMIGILYCLVETKSPKNRPSSEYLPLVFIGGTALQTFVYYVFQDIYFAFLASFISTVTVNIVLSYRFTTDKTIDKDVLEILKRNYRSTFFIFLCIGVTLWVFEMNYCEKILPYLMATGLGGATLHIIWHIAAGYAGYMLINYLTILRVDFLKNPSKLKWVLFNMVPYWEYKSLRASKQL